MKKFTVRVGIKIRERIRNKLERRKLNNPTVSIITNHCMGGIICHDLGLQFHSPTVNMKILPDDFIKFVENLQYYLEQEIVFCEDPSVSYPVGMLGDIKLWFVHYKTFEEAVDSWNRRKKRIDYNNIRIMLTLREMYNDDIMKRFEKLPYKKVAFANEVHSEYPSIIYARYHGKKLTGYISDIVNIFGKRGYQTGGFDYVEFLNN